MRIESLFEERGRDKSHWHNVDPTMVVARVKEGLERERERNEKGASTRAEIHGD